MNFPLNRFLIILVVTPLVLVACGGGQGSAPEAIEAYLEAVVTQDRDGAVNLSCVDWEDQAITEIDSFEAVSAELEGVVCEETGTAGDYTLVECTGKIVVTYDTEVQELVLEGRVYQVLQDGGQWRMCGYNF
jgi:hypothetical protein